ncbi:MAG: D-erythronate dehydrogenase [Pseudomonadota bacterium]
MTRVLIIGAAGMLGGRLARALGPAAAMLLVDRSAPSIPDAAPIETEARALDLAAPGAAGDLAAWAPDLVYHLAAVVSGQAEADFDLGYRVNLDATRALLDALRPGDRRPRVVFSSSLAVYGPPFPAVVPDSFAPAPASSYGVQKLMGEHLVSDYSRKGFIDGVSLRLPTVVVRPGAPNAATSGFMSAIIREPLNGQRATVPVSRDLAVWIASPDVTVASLVRAATMDTGVARVLSARGISVTIADMVAALGRIAGPDVAALVEDGADPAAARVVETWPSAYACAAARAQGFPVDDGIEAIIRQHIAQEHG